VHRTVGFSLVVAALALAVGAFVAVQTFPSQTAMEKMSLESLGIDSRVLAFPGVQQYLDATTGQMRHKVVEKAQRSAIEGAGAFLAIIAVGAFLIETDRRRRAGADAASPASTDPASGPPPA
jgi:hypothetical protein